ncbi:MAG: NFACT family protein [Oscillospiraceae bacterium]|nr:NFACT family protein [Oscillospiraceae bacterium]
MPLDAVVIHAIKEELEKELIGARIDKVQMPERDVLLLSVRGNMGNRKLLLSANTGSARIQFTENVYENPSEPPMFCMLMRKHLVGARIQSITQPDFDRLLVLDLSVRDEMGILTEKKLVMELMGRASNIILVDDKGNIIDCIRRADFGENAMRRLLPGMIYRRPLPQEKTPFFAADDEQRTEIGRRCALSANPEKSIMEYFSGLSPLISRELVYRCHGQTEFLPEAMDALKESVVKSEFEPVILMREGNPFDFSYMRISQYGETMELAEYSSFSELLDAFFSQKDHAESMRRKSRDLLHKTKSARDRTQRKLNARRQEMEKADDREQIRKEADLITANIYKLKKGMASFSCEDFYEPDCPERVILLDPLKTPQQNAAQKYKEYNKLKNAREHLTKLIEENTAQLDYLNSVMDEIERAESERDLAEIRRELITTGYLRTKKNARKEKVRAQGPLSFQSDDGFRILVGRNNAMNDDLSIRKARRTDYWLHTKSVHGSHVIIVCDDQTPPARTIEQAAAIAAYYSQARAGGKTPVDFTMVRNLKKPSGAMPGFVIYHVYETILAEPDEQLVMRLKTDHG